MTKMTGILYHINITSSKGLIHKIGITSNLDKRLECYNVAIPFEEIMLIKTREFSTINEAREVESLICYNFHPVGGREYFILDDKELEKFNDIFHNRVPVSSEITSKLDHKIEDVREIHLNLQKAYNRCYSNLHRLKELNHDILKRIGRLKEPKEKVVVEDDIILTPKIIIEESSYDLLRSVEYGKHYSREEFKAIIQEWINRNQLSTKYRSLHVESKMLITMVNRMIASTGKYWDTTRARNNSDKMKYYFLV